MDIEKIPSFSGSAQEIGAAYAQRYQREIAGFFTQEFCRYKYSKSFLSSCIKITSKQTPSAFAFLKGAIKQSLLSIEEHFLLMLHEEELYHRNLHNKMPHCSAIGVVVKDKNAKFTILGQNWDWSTTYYPWTSFNRFALSGAPRVLALSYPGLPVCAGLNSAGLTLMWTGAGYLPPVMPKVGVSTYALLFELLLKRDVAEAVRYLKNVQNAGAFIFLLGDSQGKFVLVEGVPGKIFFSGDEFENKPGHRANIFEFPQAITAAKQKFPSINKCHSLKRNKVMNKFSRKLELRPSVAGVKSTLSHPTLLVEKSFSHATLIQLIVNSRKKELYFRSWRQKQKRWSKVRV